MANGKGRIPRAEREVTESMLDMGRAFGSIAGTPGRPTARVALDDLRLTREGRGPRQAPGILRP